jgi:hypothetical protein
LIEISLLACGIQVVEVNGPDGAPTRNLVINDPQSGVRITVPLTVEVARRLGRDLSSSRAD